MPLYDFRCRQCKLVFEQIVGSDVHVTQCRLCRPRYLVQSGITGQSYEIPAMADRQLSAPAGIVMGDGSKQHKAQRIKEPMWLDQATGKRTPVNP